MIRLCQKFLLYLAAATDRELVKQVEYLKTENGILRSKLPKRITVTLSERNRLVRLGKAVGAAVKHLVSIVTPRTFARWLNEDKQPKESKRSNRKPGRPKTPDEIRDLVLRLARDNGWGYTRILGELKKLGVTVCRSTVINILREHGLDPGPKRGAGSWLEFIQRHVQTLWACDFFSKRIVTMRGFVEMFVLVFIHVGTRRVFVSGMTACPDAIWMKRQAKNFTMTFADTPLAASHLIRDRDGKFTADFDQILKGDGVKTVRTQIRSPNMNAYCERVIQSIKSECLDHFVVFGDKHFRYLIDQYLAHYDDASYCLLRLFARKIEGLLIWVWYSEVAATMFGASGDSLGPFGRQLVAMDNPRTVG
jgi:putative transposase